MPDPDDVREIMAAFQREGGRSLTKPWRWLVASAERANDLGEPDVAVMAYFWATNWIYDVQPTLGAQGAFQLGFDAAPDGTHEALVVQAQRAVADLPDDYVVTVSDGATITAGSVALIVAEQAKAGGNLSPHIALQRAMNATTEHQREEDENRL